MGNRVGEPAGRRCDVETLPWHAQIRIRVFIEPANGVGLPGDRYAPVIERIWRRVFGTWVTSEKTFNRVVDRRGPNWLPAHHRPMRPARVSDLRNDQRFL